MHHDTGLRMHKTTVYLYFGYKPLCRQLDFSCLVSSGDFFVADVMIPTLTAYIQVLTTVLGMPLNLLKDVVIRLRGFGSPGLFLCWPASASSCRWLAPASAYP
jgi:hypothetical protein